MPPKRDSPSPRVQRSSAPRRPATESIYKGAWMRSQLEVGFAKQLDARGIVWQYEPERLQGGRYLVDFYLPDLRCWVEVKGRFEARDQLLLPLVAGHLDGQRKERLFLYMRDRAFRVTDQGFTALTHAVFWDALGEVPDSEDLIYLRKKRDRAQPPGDDSEPTNRE